MNIADIFHQQAFEHPYIPAIIDTHNGQTRMVRYGELAETVNKTVSLLRSFNLEPGDPVLIFQPMSIELYTVLIAVFQMGLIATFLDPSAGRKHIARCCEMVAPKLMIASSKAHLLKLYSSSLAKIPASIVIGANPFIEFCSGLTGAIRYSSIHKQTPSSEKLQCGSTHPALLTFTSGSTGLPKATVRSHGFLLEQHKILVSSLNLRFGVADLSTLPIFVLSNLGSGMTSIIPNADLRKPGLINPAPVVSQIEKLLPATVGASPAFMERLADYCIAQNKQLISLEVIYTGGAPVFPRTMEKLRTMAPNAEIVAVYGSTEAEPIAHIGLSEISGDDRQAMANGRGLLTGKPIPEIDIAVFKNQWGTPITPLRIEDFDRLQLPAGYPGEIVVHGDHVLKSYLDGNGDAETKFKVAFTTWHRTGDMGYIDNQGRLWLLGRCSAVVTDNHGELYPFAVECAAMEEPWVRRAALAVKKGKRILALEVNDRIPENGISELKGRLQWAQLSDIKIIPKIPVDRRHNAKIDYNLLNKYIK